MELQDLIEEKTVELIGSGKIEEMIELIFTGAGLPLHLPKLLPNYNSMKRIPKIVPIVSSG